MNPRFARRVLLAVSGSFFAAPASGRVRATVTVDEQPR